MEAHEIEAELTASLSPHWKEPLKNALGSSQMKDLYTFLSERKKQNAVIYPPLPLVFNALNYVKPNEIRVLLIGQDPYHGEGQAHGLCFSVQDGHRVPPSLVNVYKELSYDIGARSPRSGNLTQWAPQGVLMLNTLLTVEKGTPLAHKNKGWEPFTDAVIAHANQQKEPIVFILWGDRAAKKEIMIDTSRHLIIKGVHPSPMSARRGFFGSRPFSKANAFLEKNKREPIRWKLT